MADPDTIDDDLADDAADLILEADEQLQERRAEQEAFLEDVKAESDTPIVETTCNIIGDRVVDIHAELSGELTDRIGDMEARLERLDSGEGHAYEMTEVADESCQLLADLIDDPTWDKETFYQAYQETSFDALAEMLERVFDSIKSERERQEGAAEGFRPS